MVIFCSKELYPMVHIMSWVLRGVDVLLLIKLYLKVYTLWVWLLVFFPIKLTVYTLCYGCGLFSLKQTVPYGEDIMARIECGVDVAFFSNGCT